MFGAPAVALTKDLLRQLDTLTWQYAQQNNGILPAVSAFPPIIRRSPAFQPATTKPVSRLGVGARKGLEAFDPTTVPDESNPIERQSLREAALANNRGFVAALRTQFGTPGPLDLLPASIYDPAESILLDAWGMPIVFMAGKHPMVGTAPNNRFFYFSAGADRLFWAQDDNLYSYEDLSIKAEQKGDAAIPPR